MINGDQGWQWFPNLDENWQILKVWKVVQTIILFFIMTKAAGRSGFYRFWLDNWFMKNSEIHLAFFVKKISVGTIHLFFRKELAVTLRVMPQTAAYSVNGLEAPMLQMSILALNQQQHQFIRQCALSRDIQKVWVNRIRIDVIPKTRYVIEKRIIVKVLISQS